MKTSFFLPIILASALCATPLIAQESSDEPTQHNKISEGDWQTLMHRIRNYDENALTELMDIVESRRCPGTPEELVSMLKIAAGMGEKRAQNLLAECYRQGVGVRENSKMASGWELIYHRY